MSVARLASSSSLLSSNLLRVGAALLLSSTLFGCFVEDGSPRRQPHDSTAPYAPAQEPSDPPATPPPPSTAPIAPMLVPIDTDQVMDADPGQGVGIFVEYAAGGKWHIWWTCDTTLSKQECDVALSATANEGDITGVSAEALQGGTVVTPEPWRVEARIRTTTQVHGLRFTTVPGAIVELEATVGGLREGPGPNRSFFFFVQDGKINGGYTGPLTNPLQLQGKTP